MNYFKVLWELAALKRNEKKSAVQFRQLQKRKLREMLVYAYRHSPYYRNAFEAAGLTGETVRTAPLSAFPTLDKAGLLEHFDQLITVPGLTQEELRRFDAEEKADRKPYRGKYHVVHSSGSTGTPGYFLYDEDAWNRMLVGIIRGALWGMSIPQIVRLLAQGPRIAYIAATDGRYGGAMAVGDGIDDVGARQMYLDIKTPLAEWVKQLRAFQPNIIIGYPSAIKILAELVDSSQVELEVIRLISCGKRPGGHPHQNAHADADHSVGKGPGLCAVLRPVCSPDRTGLQDGQEKADRDRGEGDLRVKEVLLQGKGLCKSFPRSGGTVLDQVDVELYARDFTVVMGPSGAGKSTLLYALSGMDRVTSGEIIYRGKPISGFSENQMARLRSREFGFQLSAGHAQRGGKRRGLHRQRH